MSLKMKIARLAKRVALKVSTNSPQLLLVGGLVAGGFALYEVAKASTKAPELMEKHTEKLEKIEDAKEHPENYEHDDGTPVDEQSYKSDKAAATKSMAIDFLKLYWKSIALVAISVVCIVSGFKIINSRLVDATALATSALATNEHIRDNIIAKYGEQEYRKLRYASKDEILEQVKDRQEMTTEEYAKKYDKYYDPFRSYDTKGDKHIFEWNPATIDDTYYLGNPVMDIMRLSNNIETINKYILPERLMLTMNDVFDILHIKCYKNQEYHDQVALIYGRNTLDVGLGDLFDYVSDRLSHNTSPEEMNEINEDLRDTVYLTIDPIGSVHDKELMKSVDWRRI